MSIWGWFRRLFTGRKRVTIAGLDRQKTILDQQQQRWANKAREKEQERDRTFLLGTQTTDERTKRDCARRVVQLDRAIKQYDSNATVLEKRKTAVLAWIRAMEAGEAAPSSPEMIAAQRETERITVENEARLKELELTTANIEGAEAGRLASAPRDSTEVEDVFRTMRQEPTVAEKKTGSTEAPNR